MLLLSNFVVVVVVVIFVAVVVVVVYLYIHLQCSCYCHKRSNWNGQAGHRLNRSPGSWSRWHNLKGTPSYINASIFKSPCVCHSVSLQSF